VGLGPVAVHVRAARWPWPLEAFRRSHPGRASFVARLDVTLAPAAGAPGPLAREDGRYRGPGFCLEEVAPGAYRADVADVPSIEGALCALLVDFGRRAPLLVMHGVSLELGGRAWCWVGPTGSGKSTWARRHPRRALGANAALVWPASSGRWWLRTLPFTGKNDSAVVPRALPLGGLVALGGPRRRARSTLEAVAWLCRGVATAKGLGPRLDLLESLARRHVVGGGVLPTPRAASVRAPTLTECSVMLRARGRDKVVCNGD
jgi:hypothetical protein